MNKNIIIFGCGKLGHEAIDVLGEENIECFCDNNPSLEGEEKYGKKIISFERLKTKYREAVIIICANVRWGNAYAMAEQCEENGITDYFLYQSVREQKFFPQRGKILDFMNDFMNRQSLKSKMYINWSENLQRQVTYLKRHIDVRYLKPAGGMLRERQLALVKAAAELMEKLSGLEIKPFLYGGNLLGYVRHNGFVPWDDDMDFALIREEYEKLRAFCRTNLYEKEEFYAQEKCRRSIDEEWKNFYYGNGSGDEFNIYSILPDGSKAVIDFFVLDYYVEGYSLDELLHLAGVMRGKLADAIFDNKKKIAYFENAVLENSKNMAKESNHIYFGIDNMEIMHTFHRGTWIPKEVVFPLQEVQYEGYCFWAPNDTEEFVKYEYEDIWTLPDDVGVPQHTRNAVNILDDENYW